MTQISIPANFDAILDTQMDAIEKPKPLPQGKYAAQVKTFKYVTSKEKQTPGAEVTFRILRPIETEDDALAQSMDYSERELRTSFWLTPDARFRAKEFLENHLGIHASGRSLGDVFNDCVNQPCTVLLVHTTAADGNVWANIKSTGPAE